MLLGVEMGWKRGPYPHQALAFFEELLLVDKIASVMREPVGKVASVIQGLADTEESAQILVSLTILLLLIQELQTDPGEA